VLAEEREDGDDAACAGAVDLGRVEGVPLERRRRRGFRLRLRRRPVSGGSRKEHRLPAAVRPADCLADRECDGSAGKSGDDERYDREGSSATHEASGYRPRPIARSRSPRFHVETGAALGGLSAGPSELVSGSESVNTVSPGCDVTFSVPAIFPASSRAIASPRPLPDALSPPTR